MAAQLERDGWTVVARNLRLGRGEIDIAALKRGLLRVVEVRSRAGAGTDPLESVGPAKQRAVASALRHAVSRGMLPPHREVRFDVAAVRWLRPGEPPEILFHEGAFDAVDLM